MGYETDLHRARRVHRVLVVDDNEDAGATLAEVLSYMGYETRYCNRARDGLRLAADFHPDTCVSDIGMPELDGYGFARMLRESGRHPGIRLIALTGYCTDKDRALAARAGFDLHLSKPVDLPNLLAGMGETLIAESTATLNSQTAPPSCTTANDSDLA
ncbi:response regulator [Duganella levis]|uniref:Response regulator n=1 Tax=Duganella levis TaxID=2692169 RepID=A0ABW9VT52_9BURK|nr:response regulator [Duganella levis]MYN24817.1 response regulator [Duganella levis]